MTRTFFTSGVGGPVAGFPAGGLKLIEGFALIFLGEVGGDAAGFASSIGMSAAAAGAASVSPFVATSAGFSSVTLSAGPPSEAASTTSEASCSPSVSGWVASTAPDPSDSTSSSWG